MLKRGMQTSRTSELVRYINLKLVALGHAPDQYTVDPNFLEIARPLLENYHQKDVLLGEQLCPADARIQAFLDDYLKDTCPHGAPRLPSNTFVLDRPGMARTLSLPARGDSFTSEYLRSYRIAQGVLHNPAADRRTTQGVFHIVEGGMPIPADKFAVPKQVFARFLAAALTPPDTLLTLPFTSEQPDAVRLFVSLLLRPLVCPATGSDPEKRMETRFFAPGSVVSNLDFVETIFGNAGDPYLPANDAALDIPHWTGHTGCVIVAPHLAGMKKTDLGLPHFDQATERQRRDGMCWRKPDERYNEGHAFKIVCRDKRGVIVTIIADNYYGYCKKEVKTQISYAANLFGVAEEEHAGGAIAAPSYVLGQEFEQSRSSSIKRAAFDDAVRLLDGRVSVHPEGYAIDGKYPDIFYVPEDSQFDVRKGYVAWTRDGVERRLTIRPRAAYVLPSGYRLRMEKQAGGGSWRLIGTVAHGTLCHKPCTVSGGGKSEISKSISSVLLQGPVFVRDYFADFEMVDEILKKDFSNIYRHPQPPERAGRAILSPQRSLGSVIKLLTQSSEYTDEYNAWLRDLHQTIRQLVFTVKRYYQPDWGDNWRAHFTVDRINGFLGHELKFENHKLVGNYLRVGFDPHGSWRIYKLRPDFRPADKVQVEDDITAAVVVPRHTLSDFDSKYPNRSVKLVENCEQYLFQRPDDAVHRGFDAQAEADLASPGTFISNFEPLTREQARAMVDHVLEFDQFTEPMQRLLREFVEKGEPEFVVSSANARLVDGKPSKNPRYLQHRPDVTDPRLTYLTAVCARLDRGVPSSEPLHFPVNVVLAGRRGNPADSKLGVPPLAVYNPVHYQELPELFMDWICSLTGKSPSTTGFGSEGALTKGPFNAVWPVVDLNNALVSAILTEYPGLTTAAGYIGPDYRMDHDISMLIPEVYCRIRVDERDPKFMIENGLLEKCEDFEYNGRVVRASRLGYRITAAFAERFLGRVFETPDQVFPEEILRPEKQDPEAFAAGVDAIVAAQERVAKQYFEDGSIAGACPPIAALLHIMAYGKWNGHGIESPEVRNMFTRESLLASDWYRERLRVKQDRDIALWTRHIAAADSPYAQSQLDRVRSLSYLSELVGTIGADPFTGQ